MRVSNIAFWVGYYSIVFFAAMGVCSFIDGCAHKPEPPPIATEQPVSTVPVVSLLEQYLGSGATISVKPDESRNVDIGGAGLKFDTISLRYDQSNGVADVKFDKPYPKVDGHFWGVHFSGPIYEFTIDNETVTVFSAFGKRKYKLQEVPE